MIIPQMCTFGNIGITWAEWFDIVSAKWKKKNPVLGASGYFCDYDCSVG